MENEYHYVSPTGLIYNSISRIPDCWTIYEGVAKEFTISITKRISSPVTYSFAIKDKELSINSCNYRRYESFLAAEHGAMERIYIIAAQTMEAAISLRDLADAKLRQLDREAQRLGIKLDQ